MLPASARLTRRDDFAVTVRRGRRAGQGTVVVHLAHAADSSGVPRVGFVVGRTVGNAVVRHRVQRRLRHLMRARLDRLPRGALVVVRALPAAAHASSAALGADVDAALSRLIELRRGSPAASTTALAGSA